MNYENNCNGCYSNICDYGANGVIQGIISPKPATIQPKIFTINKMDKINSCDNCNGVGFKQKKFICNGCKELHVSCCYKCENVDKSLEECNKCFGLGKVKITL